jgi:NADPH2:quinone reductase
VEALKQALGVPEAVCRLLALRGFNDIDSAKRFLRPRLEHLPDIAGATELLDLDRAVERLMRAARAGETVLVHGAAGGVGTATIQVAKGLGARAIGVVSSEAKADVARAAGADEGGLREGF